MKYNKFYRGLARENRAFNFVIFKPKKHALRIEMGLSRLDDIEEKLEATGLDVMEYSTRNGRYKKRLSKEDIKKHSEFLTDLLEQAYKEYKGFE